jgi:hypothetical protein
MVFGLGEENTRRVILYLTCRNGSCSAGFAHIFLICTGVPLRLKQAPRSFFSCSTRSASSGLINYMCHARHSWGY